MDRLVQLRRHMTTIFNATPLFLSQVSQLPQNWNRRNRGLAFRDSKATATITRGLQQQSTCDSLIRQGVIYLSRAITSGQVRHRLVLQVTTSSNPMDGYMSLSAKIPPARLGIPKPDAGRHRFPPSPN
ncbi:unnamed protein product [Urochloa humidicola]